jgi:pyrroline-5-carboxylate reductase
MHVGFVGGGNMAAALIGGLKASIGADWRFSVIDPQQSQRDALLARFGVDAFESARGAALSDAEIVVFAVKPQQMREAASACAPFVQRALVISVAAGIRAADLSRWLGGHRRIVRAMPNTPALIGQGATGLAMFTGAEGSPTQNTSTASEASAASADRVLADQILSAVGETAWFDDESSLDAVTALSGSGPAYVFRFMEAIEAAGIAMGLPAGQARTLTLATFAGAAQLALRADEPPAVLRERVTSKGGTTAAGLAVMQAEGIDQTILRALQAACARSVALGEEFGD